MTGRRIGFASRLQKDVPHSLLTIHCVIHVQALCASCCETEMPEVFQVVTKIVKFIVARALHHRQFQALLEEVGSERGDLLLHNSVRWLSRGAVLKRFCLCINAIREFLAEKNAPFPQLKDASWLCSLYFLTDLTEHLNSLNRRLQGKGQLIGDLCEELRVFPRKAVPFEKGPCQQKV